MKTRFPVTKYRLYMYIENYHKHVNIRRCYIRTYCPLWARIFMAMTSGKDIASSHMVFKWIYHQSIRPRHQRTSAFIIRHRRDPTSIQHLGTIGLDAWSTVGTYNIRASTRGGGGRKDIESSKWFPVRHQVINRHGGKYHLS